MVETLTGTKHTSGGSVVEILTILCVKHTSGYSVVETILHDFVCSAH